MEKAVKADPYDFTKCMKCGKPLPPGERVEPEACKECIWKNYKKPEKEVKVTGGNDLRAIEAELGEIKSRLVALEVGLGISK